MKTANEIYAAQNRVIHAVLRKLGFSYKEDRDLVLHHVGRVTGEEKGLSQLTLAERQALLRHLAKEWKMDIACPAVPAIYRSWKRGMPEPGEPRGAFKRFTGARAKQKKYIMWLWTGLGYAPEKIDARVKKQFGVDRLEWLNDPHDLHTLITDLQARAKRAGIAPSAEKGGKG